MKSKEYNLKELNDNIVNIDNFLKENENTIVDLKLRAIRKIIFNEFQTIIKDRTDTMTESRMVLVEKYAEKDENGKPKIEDILGLDGEPAKNENGTKKTRFVIQPENKEIFDAEFKKIWEETYSLKNKFKIQFNPVKYADLQGQKIKGVGLEDFFE